MKTFLSRPHAKPLLILAGICFLLAAFLALALIGYGTLALLFAALGVVFLLYLLLPKFLRVILTILIVLAAAAVVAALIPVILAAGGDGDTDADHIIVLGAGVNGDVPSLALTDRLRAAQDYLEGHPNTVAILSGGQGRGENITEAEAMYRWLRARGIAEARLIKEERATSTLENLEYSYALIPDADAAAVGVVSSEYHLYRAKLLAETLGHEVSGIPAATSLPLLKINYFLREALGLIYYQIFGIG